MKIIFTFLLSSICSLAWAQPYTIVLETNFDGQVVYGNKNELIQYIREGKPVRVGWQLDFNEDKVSDFDHWVEATFITILGNEVFTQIDPIYAQSPDLKKPQVEIFPDNTKWTALIGTNGILLNRFVLNETQKPNLVYDDSSDISIEEFELQKKKAEDNWKAMNEVHTWKVATFWSIQK